MLGGIATDFASAWIVGLITAWIDVEQWEKFYQKHEINPSG